MKEWDFLTQEERPLPRARLAARRPTRLLFLLFLTVLVPSTALMMTPWVSTEAPLGFVDALFMATSALTVTGFGTVDPGTQFNLAGELLMMGLMELGGLGLMSFSVLLVTFLSRRVGMTSTLLIHEELNMRGPMDVISIARAVVRFALLCQLIGAVVLSLVFVPRFGLAEGVRHACFLAISAFNNAGFTLFSDSLEQFVGHPVVLGTVAALFIIGGLGFTVIIDIIRSRGRRLRLHSKLTLVTTGWLLVVGTVALFFLEQGNPHTFGHIDSKGVQWLSAFFQAASTRTAGFNSIDIENMRHGSLLLMMALMFIGAGSTSTGGGIKVSTFAVGLIATRAFLEGRRDFVAFGRAIQPMVVLRSLAIMVITVMGLMLAMMGLMIAEKAPIGRVFFETVSAASTVGLSDGLTARLSTPGKLILSMVMVVGRVGPLTLAYLLVRPTQRRVRYPSDEVITG